MANVKSTTLSQGEKQRVAVARALVNSPSLIIADEPTGSLSTKQGIVIIEYLQRIVKERNCSLIIASHDERIIEYADEVFRLSDGNLSGYDTSQKNRY